MSLKDWMGKAKRRGRGKKAEQQLSAGDLVNLGRFEEALELLEDRVRRRPQEHHSRLKLADLLMKVGRRAEGVEEYLRVTEGFERDGFYNKASALVTKIARLLPGDERLTAKARRLDRIKRLDHVRKVVMENLPPTISMTVEQEWLSLAKGDLLSRLSEDQLQRLLPHLTLRQYEEKEEVVSAGVRRDELLWIVSGEISARVVLPNGSVTDIRTFGGGDLVGELALFSHQPWSAIYVASSKAIVLVLDRNALEKSLVGEDDPRSLLEALRAEKNDEAVQQAVSKMTAMRGDE